MQPLWKELGGCHHGDAEQGAHEEAQESDHDRRDDEIRDAPEENFQEDGAHEVDPDSETLTEHGCHKAKKYAPESDADPEARAHYGGCQGSSVADAHHVGDDPAADRYWNIHDRVSFMRMM